jgi:nucleoside-diphosphate-sugar epimerase
MKEFRISIETLRAKRTAKQSVLLLTGVTGFIGSHLAMEFLTEGNPVFLIARPGKCLRGEERVVRMLGWFGAHPRQFPRLRIIEGFIDRPRLGLSPALYDELLARVDEIIHCASNTTFAERKRAEVERANLHALENVVAVAAEGRCAYFHHVSTAYAAGRRAGLCREELEEPGPFTNVYEETKYRGERIAAERCRAEGIRLNIYRPSIVYGHSRTGKSPSFRGLYYPIRTVLFIKRSFERDLHAQGGRSAQRIGAGVQDDGSFHLPLRVKVEAEGGLNLIPIDFFVSVFRTIWQDGLAGGVFHIVNHRVKKVEEIIEYTQRLFCLTGIRIASAEDFVREPKNPLEILLENSLQAYLPYIEDMRIFEQKRTEGILQKQGLSCPDLDWESFCRCMKFALDKGWEAESFDERG